MIESSNIAYKTYPILVNEDVLSAKGIIVVHVGYGEIESELKDAIWEFGLSLKCENSTSVTEELEMTTVLRWEVKCTDLYNPKGVFLFCDWAGERYKDCLQPLKGTYLQRENNAT